MAVEATRLAFFFFFFGFFVFEGDSSAPFAHALAGRIAMTALRQDELGARTRRSAEAPGLAALPELDSAVQALRELPDDLETIQSRLRAAIVACRPLYGTAHGQTMGMVLNAVLRDDGGSRGLLTRDESAARAPKCGATS